MELVGSWSGNDWVVDDIIPSGTFLCKFREHFLPKPHVWVLFQAYGAMCAVHGIVSHKHSPPVSCQKPSFTSNFLTCEKRIKHAFTQVNNAVGKYFQEQEYACMIWGWARASSSPNPHRLPRLQVSSQQKASFGHFCVCHTSGTGGSSFSTHAR